MSETHFFGKVAQKALIVKAAKVLITRDSRDVDTWELPGGRINVDEDSVEGLKREVREELGVELSTLRLMEIGRMQHKKNNLDMLVIYYEATLATEEFKVDPFEVAEMKWVGKDDYFRYKYFPEYERCLKNYFENIL